MRSASIFYGRALELEFLHKIDRVDERLTTFMLGNTYVIAETGSVAHDRAKGVEGCPIKFRFNVPDVKATCDEIRIKGIEINVLDHTWGATAEFSDPDGNLCALMLNDGFGD